MELPIYIVEGLYLLLFLATVWRYLRQRDPITRDLALIFSPLAIAFVAELWERAAGAPAPASAQSRRFCWSRSHS